MAEENEGMTGEISSIIEDFVADAPAIETPVVENAGAGTETITDTKGEVTTGGEGQGIQEGQERKPEETGGQVTAGAAGAQKEEVVTEKPAGELTELEMIQRERDELRKQLSEMAAATVTPPKHEYTEAEKAEIQRRQEAQKNQVLAFVSDEETFDAVMQNVGNFNAILTSVVNTAVERSLRLMPQVASRIADEHVSTQIAVRDFFNDNRDLLEHRKYVAFVSNEVQAKNPQLPLDEILQKVETEVRSRLKIPRPAGAQTSTTSGVHRASGQQPGRTVLNPGFTPGSSGGRKGGVNTEQLSADQKGILDLIS